MTALPIVTTYMIWSGTGLIWIWVGWRHLALIKLKRTLMLQQREFQLEMNNVDVEMRAHMKALKENFEKRMKGESDGPNKTH